MPGLRSQTKFFCEHRGEHDRLRRGEGGILRGSLRDSATTSITLPHRAGDGPAPAHPGRVRACALRTRAGPAPRVIRVIRVLEKKPAPWPSAPFCARSPSSSLSLLLSPSLFPPLPCELCHRGRCPCGKVSRGVIADAAPPCAPWTALGVAVLGRFPVPTVAAQPRRALVSGSARWRGVCHRRGAPSEGGTRAPGGSGRA